MKTGRWGISWMALPVVAGLMLCGGCDEQAPVGRGDSGSSGGVEDPAVPGAEVVSLDAPAVAVQSGDSVSGPPVTPQVAAVRKWEPGDAGFARYLPADTSYYVKARKLGVAWEWLEQFKDEDAVSRVEEMLESPEALQKMAEDLGADGVNEEAVEQMKAAGEKYGEDAWLAIRSGFGEEVFFSMRGVDWWLGLLDDFEDDVPRWSAKVSELQEMQEDEELMKEEMMALWSDVADRLREKFSEVDDLPVLGMQFGGKVTEDRDEVMRVLRKSCEDVVNEWDVAKAHSFEKGGTSWTGLKIRFASFTDDDFKESMKELKERPDGERLFGFIDMLLQQELVFAFGEVGDYVVFYLGLGEQSLEVAGDAARSLAGREEMGFLGEFPVDGLLGMAWQQQEIVDLLHRQSGLELFWKGLAEAVEESGDMKSGAMMAASARKLAELANKRNEGTAHAWVGALALLDGLRFETRGGWLGKELDLESPLKMAGAMHGRDDQLLMRAHWKKSEAHTELGVQQLEEVVQMVRLIGVEFQAALANEPEGEDEGDEDGDDRRKHMLDLYQSELVRSLEDIWKGYREHFMKAVGGEVAVMVDLGGETPPIMGLEDEVLKNGRIPRFAYLRPVKDRGEMQKTWELWRGSGVRMLGMVSEAIEQPIPFPDTMSADKDDLRTHFFSMPFATDDFLPSLSVSDELFMVGTSKKFSEELYETIVVSPSEGELATGVIVEISGSALWEFCDNWFDVSLRQSELLREMNEEGEDDSPSALESLMGGASWEDAIRKGIDQARWFRGASYRKWLDEGVPHSSTRIHWGDPVELAE